VQVGYLTIVVVFVVSMVATLLSISGIGKRVRLLVDY